jgi:hypothetical protein
MYNDAVLGMGRKQEQDQSDETRHRLRNCRKVFEDENLVLLEDRVTDAEVRWHAIGMVEAPFWW